MLCNMGYYKNKAVDLQCAILAFNKALRATRGWAQVERTRLRILQPACYTLAHARVVSSLCQQWTRHPRTMPLVSLANAAEYQLLATGKGALTTADLNVLELLILGINLPSPMHQRAAALFVVLDLTCHRAGVTLKQHECAACGQLVVSPRKIRKRYCTKRCAKRSGTQRFRAKKAAATLRSS